MSGAGKQALAGKSIVVTRPARQSAYLAEAIRTAGGDAILFPVIEIADIDDTRPLLALIDRLDDFDRAIFISPNAVYKAMTLIKARRALPPQLAFAAVGQATVRELGNFGVTAVTAPARFDSEALLALPEMQDVAGKRMVIFRGVGGRELLGETLTARGAVVEYVECYRRVLPHADPAPLLKAWERNEVHAVVVTSSEGLRNLYALVGAQGRPWLQKTPLFVPHPRIAAAAHELQFAAVVQTTQGDDGLMQGLQQWFAARA
jgi:uroporphyrinogen-III synthase